MEARKFKIKRYYIGFKDVFVEKIDKDTVVFTKQYLTEAWLIPSKKLGTFKLYTPDTTDLSLEQSKIKIKFINEVIKKLINCRTENKNTNGKAFYSYDNNLLDDLMVEIISIPTTLCMAIESFANQKIDESKMNYEYKKGCLWDSYGIQRYATLEEKILKILPKIQQKKFEVQSDLYKSFKKILNLRNRTVHQKKLDKSNQETLQIIHALIDCDFDKLLKDTEKLIKHFDDSFVK